MSITRGHWWLYFISLEVIRATIVFGQRTLFHDSAWFGGSKSVQRPKPQSCPLARQVTRRAPTPNKASWLTEGEQLALTLQLRLPSDAASNIGRPSNNSNKAVLKICVLRRDKKTLQRPSTIQPALHTSSTIIKFTLVGLYRHLVSRNLVKVHQPTWGSSTHAIKKRKISLIVSSEVPTLAPNQAKRPDLMSV